MPQRQLIHYILLVEKPSLSDFGASGRQVYDGGGRWAAVVMVSLGGGDIRVQDLVQDLVRATDGARSRCGGSRT